MPSLVKVNYSLDPVFEGHLRRQGFKPLNKPTKPDEVIRYENNDFHQMDVHVSVLNSGRVRLGVDILDHYGTTTDPDDIEHLVDHLYRIEAEYDEYITGERDDDPRSFFQRYDMVYHGRARF